MSLDRRREVGAEIFREHKNLIKNSWFFYHPAIVVMDAIPPYTHVSVLW